MKNRIIGISGKIGSGFVMVLIKLVKVLSGNINK